MFKKNAFLAVVGDDDDFWLCRVVKKVELSARFLKVGRGLFDVNWLENDGGDAAVYSVSTTANAVELKSVVTRVYLKRRKDGRDVEYSLDFWNLSYFMVGFRKYIPIPFEIFIKRVTMRRSWKTAHSFLALN